ncbi:MAG: replication restart helicase PriA [Christensenellales bacterium]|jgi:primosomal protein N' (replication factor Y)
MAQYAQIIVDIASASVDRVFDYRIPGTLAGRVVPGARVSVPFSRRRVEGYVIALAAAPSVEASRVRDIEAVLDEEPPLLPSMLEMAAWLRDTTYCRLVDALRVMLPAQMRGDRVRVKSVRTVTLAQSDEETQQVIDALPARAARQRAALSWLMQNGGQADTAQLARETGADSTTLRRMCERGWLALEDRAADRRPYAGLKAEPGEPPEPTWAQRQAVEAVGRAIERGEGRFLLHGVTGSGKTEVYMLCAHRALERGRTVIILVPEISLTPQMVACFTGRFGDRAAVLHSRLSAGERFDEWRRIRQGRATVVIGARSAIFAPVSDLGLVVVDEEHEMSYRSESAPRYDAVTVAEYRCAREGAALVLGSATPSVERYYAAEQGRYTLLRLMSRIEGRPMPFVEVVDMRGELAAGNRSVISRKLYTELEQCLGRGEQAILFLNRRGFSSFVSCRACGYVCRCALCDISLTYHRGDESLQCHYCGQTEPVPTVCPACGSRYIKYFGGGTQRVEEAVAKLFPGVRMLRMDADTTRGKDSHLMILDAFRLQKAQILIGTQMIAKGLDYPMVTLVGVVAADLTLHLPDWRSVERTFQLVLQVAGRAGRDERPGRVIVQTYDPDHYSIEAAAAQDYEAFYRQEIEARKAALYPPFTQFLRLVYTNEDAGCAAHDADDAERAMQRALQEHPQWRTSILRMDRTPAPISRLRGRYREQLLLRIYPRLYGDDIARALSRIAQNPASGSVVSLEMNPASML